MDAIYGCAYLTIVAADGQDANAGLRRLHTHATYPERPVSIAGQQRRLTILPKVPEYESTLQGTVWSTRGWTYQEMVLSSRIVVFTGDQVFFSALGKREQESYELGESSKQEGASGRKRQRQTQMTRTTQDSVIMEIADSHQRQKEYFNAVTEYTIRFLTYEGDRFDAFYGIPRSFAPVYGSIQDAHVLSGILTLEGAYYFQDCLLGWRIAGPSHRITHNKPNTRALPS